MPAALALKKKSRQVDDGGESSTRRVSKRSRRNQEDDEGDDELVVDGERNAGRDEDDRGEGSSQSALARLDKSVLVSSLEERRRAVLQRLSGHVTSTDDLVCLDEQARALEQTLKATVQRGESNSVLLVGPRGSGKDAILKTSLASLGSPTLYHHVQISARRCTTDRAAMRELAHQLIQLGALSMGQDEKLGLDEEDEDEADEDEEGEGGDAPGGKNDDADGDDEDEEKAALGTAVLSSLTNTTSSILSMLASASSTSSTSSAKPLVITLDSFDLLTARPRQALLYCLLDAVQSGSYRPGLAIVGMTRRPDTTDLLEKRVKSRFSHRIVQCYPPGSLEEWKLLVDKALSAGKTQEAQFDEAWDQDVKALLTSESFADSLQATVDISKDAQMVFQSLLYPIIAALSPASASLSPQSFSASRTAFGGGNGVADDDEQAVLYQLPVVPFMLLIAAKHLELRADRSVFNFEMLLAEMTAFLRRSRREREAAGTGGMGLKASDGASDPATPTRKAQKSQAATPGSGVGRVADDKGSSAAWDDRQRAMLAFEELLSLELLLPDAFLSTLSFGPTAIATGAPPPLVKSTLVPAAAKATAVRREYLRVRSVLEPHVVADVAKARGKKGTLTTDVVQWAVARTVV